MTGVQTCALPISGGVCIWFEQLLNRSGGQEKEKRLLTKSPRYDRRQGESKDDRLFQRGRRSAERIKLYTALETRTIFRGVLSEASGQRPNTQLPQSGEEAVLGTRFITRKLSRVPTQPSEIETSGNARFNRHC